MPLLVPFIRMHTVGSPTHVMLSMYFEIERLDKSSGVTNITANKDEIHFHGFR